MIEPGVVRGHLLKKVLPFSLALLAGATLAGTFRHRRHQPHRGCRAFEYESFGPPHGAAAGPAQAPFVLPAAGVRAPPELHVLSSMTMEEVRRFELCGGGYEAARVVSPPSSQYRAAGLRDYEQSVLQLSFLFGADGRVSEVTPLAKPHDCGDCLRGVNVTRIDPGETTERLLVEAAEEAVRGIKFEPGKLGGEPVAMRGLAECVFRR